MDVQVRIVGEARERYLVVTGYVEAKLTEAEIRARLRPAIEDSPTIALLELMNNLRGAYADAERAKSLLLTFVGNDDLVRLLPIVNDAAVIVIVVHLQEDVILGVVIVEHPLQQVSFGRHRRKSKSPRGRNDSIQNEVSAFASERIPLLLP